MIDLITRIAERKSSDKAANCEAADDAYETIPEPKIAHEKKFKCTYCKRTFRTKNGVETHIEDHGESGVNFQFSILYA